EYYCWLHYTGGSWVF
nr:immunoglobulin light chain junction region [Macaca mulatta]MOX17253.1 immunoglobulin light chain junction region [Macaca mulatta]MOX17350.1 immunoglobulin light chain junction region [Macaca mulatta]MOX17957.1 immunoglobulin light chain junction region [Macaca mulatta]MOX18250.1 immunoglobulin light chain junction region [Macaca mulatta]